MMTKEEWEGFIRTSSDRGQQLHKIWSELDELARTSADAKVKELAQRAQRLVEEAAKAK